MIKPSADPTSDQHKFPMWSLIIQEQNRNLLSQLYEEPFSDLSKNSSSDRNKRTINFRFKNSYVVHFPIVDSNVWKSICDALRLITVACSNTEEKHSHVQFILH